MPDLQCSWWPDVWFGKSLTEFCAAHDLGGSDWQLLIDVASQGGAHFLALGVTMYVGVKLGRPLYLVYKRLRNKGK